MKVKVFTTNEKGKIEFTKEELEKLLDEVYQDGRNGVITINGPSTNAPWWGTSDTVLLCNELNKLSATDTTTAIR